MNELMTLDNFPFHFEINTGWRDLDAFGHVNNATFATYVEDARISMFERWNLSQTSGKRSVIAASLKLDFKTTSKILKEICKDDSKISKLAKKIHQLK